jgi:hypothetical protein
MRSGVVVALATALLYSHAAAYELVVNTTSTWSYLDNNADLGATAWRSLAFNDAAWKTGRGQIGFGDGDENTLVPVNTTTTTYYFRKVVNLGVDPANLTACVFGVLADDGAVLWVNGIEVGRKNMGAQPAVKHTDLALTSLSTSTDEGLLEYYSFNPAGVLRQGDNVFAVEVHQGPSGGSDLSFDGFVLLSNERDVPFLLFGPVSQALSKTSVAVKWFTSSPTLSRVFYSTVLGTPVRLLRVQGATLKTAQSETVTGLTADTPYSFTVGASDPDLPGPVMLASGQWNLLPSTTTALPAWSDFLFLGDAGTGLAEQTKLATALSVFKTNTGSTLSNIVTLGGAAYPSSTLDDLKGKFMKPYSRLLSSAFTYGVWGVRETLNNTASPAAGPYFDTFFPVAAPVAGTASGSRLYYSFDWGAVHFVVLDSVSSNRSDAGPMVTWLRSDLAATRAANTSRWLVAVSHHAPYTSGVDNSDTNVNSAELRRNVLPVLESFGLDLFIAGHTRAYERTVLLSGFNGTSTTYNASRFAKMTGAGPYFKPVGLTPNDGAVYVVAGSAGGATETSSLIKSYMAKTSATTGAVILSASLSTLDVRFLNADGAVVDRFQVYKVAMNTSVPSATPAPASPTATATASTTATAGGTPSSSPSPATVTPSTSVVPTKSAGSTAVTPSLTATVTPTATKSVVPAVSGSTAVTPSVTPTATKSGVPAASGSTAVTPSVTPTATKSVVPAVSGSTAVTPSVTPTVTATVTKSAVPAASSAVPAASSAVGSTAVTPSVTSSVAATVTRSTVPAASTAVATPSAPVATSTVHTTASPSSPVVPSASTSPAAASASSSPLATPSASIESATPLVTPSAAATANESPEASAAPSTPSSSPSPTSSVGSNSGQCECSCLRLECCGTVSASLLSECATSNASSSSSYRTSTIVATVGSVVGAVLLSAVGLFVMQRFRQQGGGGAKKKRQGGDVLMGAATPIKASAGTTVENQSLLDA